MKFHTKKIKPNKFAIPRTIICWRFFVTNWCGCVASTQWQFHA